MGRAKGLLSMSPYESASENFKSHLGSNPYPGRGLIIGKSKGGASWLQVYFIMGRSPNSRNRQFGIVGGTLETQPFDPSKVEDPSLIIYEAMLEWEKRFLVSNGDQTRTLLDGLNQGKTMGQALASREREPDGPNFTPRITGLLDLSVKERPLMALSILKANKIDPSQTDRHFFHVAEPNEGLGYGLTTYRGDGDPLPSFTGEPLLMPLEATAEETLERYWEVLDEDNRISLAVKEIDLMGVSSRIVSKNKYQ